LLLLMCAFVRKAPLLGITAGGSIGENALLIP